MNGEVGFSSASNFGASTNVTLNGGGLQWESNTLDISSALNVTIGASGGTLDTNGNNVSLANAIGGASAGPLTKAGSGILSLASGSNAFASVTVSKGTLQAINTTGSATGSGAVTVNSGGTLGGSGFISGTVSVASGGIILPGTNGMNSGVGTLTVGGLNLSSGANANFEMGSGSNSLVDVTGSNDLTIGASPVDVNLFIAGTNSNFSTPGVYDLFQYTGTIGGSGVSSLVDPTVPVGENASFGTASVGPNNFITLSIVGTGAPGWNSQVGGNWNVNGNWTNLTAYPNAQGATAILDAPPTGLTAPASILLGGSNITVGTLAFSSSIGYTIAPTAGESLVLDNGSSAASITVAGGNQAISAPVVLNSNVNVALTAGTLTISGAISDGAQNGLPHSGSIFISGAGTLALNAANSYSGSTNIAGGTIQIGNTAALSGSTVNFTGSGTLQIGNAINSQTVSNPIGLGVGVTGTIDTQANNITYSGVVSSTDTSGMLGKAGTGTLILTGTSTSTGGMTISAGTVQVSDGVTNPTLPTGNVTDNGTLAFNTNGDTTFANSVSGTGNLVQNGVNILTLTGTNTQGGGTIVGAGSTVSLYNAGAPLAATQQASAGGGPITIDNGGTFIMNGSSNAAGGTNGTGAGWGNLGDNVVVANGATATFGLTARGSWLGNLSGGTAALPSTLNLDVVYVRGGIAGDWSGFTGTVNFVNSTNGNANASNGTGTLLEFNGNLNAPNTVVNLDPTMSLVETVANGVVTLGDLSAPNSTGTIGGTPVSGTGAVTFIIGSAETAGEVTDISCTIDDEGHSTAITKTGLGTLNLTGGSNFTGTITVEQGTLTFNGAEFQPLTNAGIVMGSATTGGILDLGGFPFSVAGLSTTTGSPGPNIIGNSTGNPSTLTVTGGTSTFAGTIQDELSGVQTYANGSQTGTAYITLDVTGGTTTMTGANAYTGGTNITGGTLQTGSVGALSFGGVVDPGHTPGSTTIGTGSPSPATGTLDLDGQSITEPITLQGGSLINSSTTTAAIVTSGVKGVGLNGGGGYATAPNVGFSGGGGSGAAATVSIDGSGNVTGITMTNPGTGYTSAPSVSFDGSGGASPGSVLISSVQLNNNSYIGGAGALTVLPIITGGGGLTKMGTGTTTLPAANTFGGPVNLEAGILAAPILTAGGTASSIGTSSSAPSSLILSGGTLQYSGTVPVTTDRLFTINPTGGSLDSSGSAPIDFASTGTEISQDAAALNGVTANSNSAVVTLPSGTDASQLVVGMTITDANGYFPNPTTITAINFAANTITLSNPTIAGVANGSADNLSFSIANPTFTLTGSNSGANSLSGILTNTPGGGLLGLTKSGTGSWTLTGANTYTGNTNVSQGILNLANGGAIASPNFTVAASATANVTGFLSGLPAVTANGAINLTNATSGLLQRTWTSLTLSSTGTVTMTAPSSHADRTVLVTSALNFGGSSPTWQGLMDMNANDMVVHNGNVANIFSQIAQGYNSGHWNGTAGLTSSAAAATNNTALGYEQNKTSSGGVFYSSFDGVSGLTTSDVLVKYTYFGDANLDGVVNGSDYTLIDNGFNNNLTGWHNGDFNYDGVVNGDDYTLIDNSFNTQGASLAGASAAPAEMIAVNTSQIAGGSSSAVPEPTVLTLLGVGSLGLLGRRRRRS